MPAGYYDILCEQGATLLRTFTWRDKKGDPVPLAGYEARMQVRRFASDEEVLVELTTENGGISFPDEGKIQLTIDAPTTTDLTPGVAFYDLELESPEGIVTRLLRGKFIVDPEVTR
jgi:hypothetical protein